MQPFLLHPALCPDDVLLFNSLGFYVTVCRRSYHLSPSRSRDELGVLCQTSRLVDGGVSLEAVSAVGAHKQMGGGEKD